MAESEHVMTTDGEVMTTNLVCLPGDSGNRFNFEQSYRAYRRIYRNRVGIRPSNRFLKELRRVRPVWKGDEHLIFRILVPREWTFEMIRCPGCGKRDVFQPGIDNVIAKSQARNDWVRGVHHRTLGCVHCSFSFHPLAHTPYRHTRIDLRKWALLTFLEETNIRGYQYFKPSDLAEILDVSQKTVRRMLHVMTETTDSFSRRIVKLYAEKGVDHPLFDLEIQLFALIINGRGVEEMGFAPMTEEQVKHEILRMIGEGKFD